MVATLEVLTAQILPRVQGVHECLGMDSGGCGRGQEPSCTAPCLLLAFRLLIALEA